jgi:hypothetical protein
VTLPFPDLLRVNIVDQLAPGYTSPSASLPRCGVRSRCNGDLHSRRTGLGVVLATSSLIWQFAVFALSGPRVTVQLLLGVTDDDRTNVASWSAEHAVGDHPNSAWFAEATRELAIIVVRNKGRAAVNVVRVGLATERRQRWFSFEERYIALDNDPPTKLEPGDLHQYELDLWPLIDYLQPVPRNKDMRVTAAVELGSGRWKRWRHEVLIVTDRKSIKPGVSADYEPVNRAGALKLKGLSGGVVRRITI